MTFKLGTIVEKNNTVHYMIVFRRIRNTRAKLTQFLSGVHVCSIPGHLVRDLQRSPVSRRLLQECFCIPHSILISEAAHSKGADLLIKLSFLFCTYRDYVIKSK